jgi:L-lysine exporter family protein LysE/ArgO
MDITSFGTGFALSASLIVAIGAQNAFVLRQGLRREHVLPIVAFCAIADALLMAAGVAGVGSVLQRVPVLADVLTFGGAAFLLAYGARAFWRARSAGTLSAAASSGAMPLSMALAQAAAFTLLNPHVYLDTVLLVGSIGAALPMESRATFVAGAAMASLTWFAALGFGARLLEGVFARPAAWRVLDIAIGLTMWALAIGLLLNRGRTVAS